VPDDVAYGPMHKVALTEGCVLHQQLGEREISVNSLHGQGIDRLREGCRWKRYARTGRSRPSA